MLAVFRFRFIACIQIQSFIERFIFHHLSTLPRLECHGSHGAKKTLPTCFVLSARTSKFLPFYVFFHTLQRTRNVWRLNSQISQDDTFVHYPFFVLNILLFIFFTFSYRNFFPLFVVLTYFDSSRPQRHATGTEIVRAKMTSLDAIFCGGNKSSSRSRSGFALVNKFELDLEARLSYRICITSRALLSTTKNAVSS